MTSTPWKPPMAYSATGITNLRNLILQASGLSGDALAALTAQVQAITDQPTLAQMLANYGAQQ